VHVAIIAERPVKREGPTTRSQKNTVNRSVRQSVLAATTLLLLLVVAASCNRPEPAPQQARPEPAAPAPAAAVPARSEAASDRHDLSVDEALGGHTLARHVGRTDEQLRDRLRREPQISSASTYTDRPTAERVVGEALASAGRPFQSWRARSGRRPNFVLRYTATGTIGRSMERGASQSVPCERALVVLRWDDRRQQFYVLTSYPEQNQ
jgi:hypothetical protein